MFRTLLVSLSLLLLLSADRCPAIDRMVVSVIYSSDMAAYKEAWKGFKDYLDQERISLWVSEYSLKEDKKSDLLRKITNEKPDAVFAIGTRAAAFAKETITAIPIVFCMVLDPQDLSGEGITGASMRIPFQVQLQYIRRILPRTRRIGILFSPKTAARHDDLLEAAGPFEYQIVEKTIDSGKALPDALQDVSWRIDCFLMIPDSEIYFPKSVEFLLQHSLDQEFPVIGLSSYYTRAGALFSLDCDYADLGRQAAEIAIRICDGERPGSIAPTVPRTVFLTLNKATAQRLGIDIPPDIQNEAREVFGE